MACRCGSTSVVLALAGAAAVGVFGLMSATGTSVCSLFSACDTEAAAPVAMTVANTDGASKSCCPLGKTAKATAVANTEPSSCDSKAKAVNASNSGCDKPCDGEAKAVNAAAEGQCPFMKAQQASAAAASCESKASCSDAKTVPASLVSFAFAAGDLPVVTPVFHAECGAVAYDCSVRAINASNLVESGGCSGTKAACATEASVKADCSEKSESTDKAEVKAVNAASTADVKASACCQASKAKAVNAAATECKNLTDGCKGDGQNGCCGGCADTKAEAKPAATTAAKGE